MYLLPSYRLTRYHCKLALGDDQFYYVILHENKESIWIVFCPDQNGTVGADGIKERLKLFKEFRQNLCDSLTAIAKSLKKPIPFIPCPICAELHIKLDLICGKRKSVIRCDLGKIPPNYYLDFRDSAGLLLNYISFDSLLIKESNRISSCKSLF